MARGGGAGELGDGRPGGVGGLGGRPRSQPGTPPPAPSGRRAARSDVRCRCHRAPAAASMTRWARRAVVGALGCGEGAGRWGGCRAVGGVRRGVEGARRAFWRRSAPHHGMGTSQAVAGGFSCPVRDAAVSLSPAARGEGGVDGDGEARHGKPAVEVCGMAPWTAPVLPLCSLPI